ncbi:MAG: ABC transporter substrate-binding protein [Acidimicrobiia bacterium]
MRRLLMLSFALALLGAACTNSGDDTSSTSSVPAASSSSSSITVATTTTTTSPPDGFGGEIRLGVDLPIASLNPFSQDAFGERLAGNAVWAMVYDIDPETWERMPDTVVSLPSQSDSIEVNDDGTMTVRYDVRVDARWSDGLSISGEDVAFTAEAMRALAIAGEPSVHPIMATVVSTDFVEQIAFITFAEPNLVFEDALWIILPSHALDGVDLVDGSDGSDWPSGGPFIVESFGRFNEARFVRNDLYWKEDDSGRSLPYIDQFTIVESTEPDLQGNEPASPTSGFVAGELDVAVIPPWPEDLARVAGVADQGATFETVASSVVEQITVQFAGDRDEANPVSWNDLLAYRQAVAHAIDRDVILEETGVPWSDGVPGMLIPGAGSAWTQYDYDPQAAGALIDELGDETEEGTPQARLSTTGNGDYRIRIGDALEPRFAAIGVGYEPIYLDSVLFFGDTLATGAFDLGMWAWLRDGGYQSTLNLMDIFDPANDAAQADLGNWASTASSGADRFSEIVDAVRSTIDADRFAELVAEAEQILADELVVIPLFNRSTTAAWWTDAVDGVVANGSQSTLTWNVEEWQRVGE